ncbi:MAG: hypothetical protein J6O56_02720 [Bacilli bacterium]|nr:hypothetical protein [Bacilli bacterium]
MLKIFYSQNTLLIVGSLILAVAIGGYLCYTKIDYSKKTTKKATTKKAPTKKTTTTKKKSTKKK